MRQCYRMCGEDEEEHEQPTGEAEPPHFLDFRILRQAIRQRADYEHEQGKVDKHERTSVTVDAPFHAHAVLFYTRLRILAIVAPSQGLP